MCLHLQGREIIERGDGISVYQIHVKCPDNVHIEWQQEVAQLPQKLPPLRGGLVS